jgi:hypothetical protein
MMPTEKGTLLEHNKPFDEAAYNRDHPNLYSDLIAILREHADPNFSDQLVDALYALLKRVKAQNTSI